MQNANSFPGFRTHSLYWGLNRGTSWYLPSCRICSQKNCLKSFKLVMLFSNISKFHLYTGFILARGWRAAMMALLTSAYIYCMTKPVKSIKILCLFKSPAALLQQVLGLLHLPNPTLTPTDVWWLVGIFWESCSFLGKLLQKSQNNICISCKPIRKTDVALGSL